MNTSTEKKQGCLSTSATSRFKHFFDWRTGPITNDYPIEIKRQLKVQHRWLNIFQWLDARLSKHDAVTCMIQTTNIKYNPIKLHYYPLTIT